MRVNGADGAVEELGDLAAFRDAELDDGEDAEAGRELVFFADPEPGGLFEQGIDVGHEVRENAQECFVEEGVELRGIEILYLGLPQFLLEGVHAFFLEGDAETVAVFFDLSPVLGGEQDIAEDIPFLDLPGLFQQAVHPPDFLCLAVAPQADDKGREREQGYQDGDEQG